MDTMTDDTSKELTTQQRAAIGKTAPNGVSGRLKTALDDMVWNATPWEEAARKANLTVRSMRLAMRRPHVLSYLRDERRVLLATASPKNLKRLGELRDQDSNMAAAVTAAKTLEALADESLPPGAMVGGGARAGFVIDLSDETTGLSVRIVSPLPQRHGDAALDITPNADTPD
jgi:hypothetical protein